MIKNSYMHTSSHTRWRKYNAQWLNSAGTRRNGVPPPLFSVPPPHFSVPPLHFSVPPPHFSVPRPHFSVPPPRFSVPPTLVSVRLPLCSVTVWNCKFWEENFNICMIRNSRYIFSCVSHHAIFLVIFNNFCVRTNSIYIHFRYLCTYLNVFTYWRMGKIS